MNMLVDLMPSIQSTTTTPPYCRHLSGAVSFATCAFAKGREVGRSVFAVLFFCVHILLAMIDGRKAVF
jgi:hypothetical protein